MLELAAALLERLDRGEAVAVATVTRIDGSAPRTLGTAMAVDAAGAVIGSISGGCVEGAVYEACLEVLETGMPVVQEFGYSDDDAFAVGLACGGRIEVMVQKVEAPSPSLHAELVAAAGGTAAGVLLVTAGAALGTLLAAGSDPAEADGAAAGGGPARGGLTDGGPARGGLTDGGLARGGLTDGGLARGGLTGGGLTGGGLAGAGLADGGLASGGQDEGRGGGAGGESVEGAGRTGGGTLGVDARRRLLAELAARIRIGRSGVAVVDCEDGPVEALFVVASTQPRMIVFGAVDFSVALSNAAALLGYRVTVCDARPVFATPERFPAAAEVVVEWPAHYLARTEIDSRTAVVVLTHDDRFDIPLLEVALALPVAYVGAMGSRRTHDRRLESLRPLVGDSSLARLHSPIGLDIGASTPEETALSILAEIVAVRNAASGARLRALEGPIHRPPPIHAVTGI
ncbi:XdhC family protein [Subtercola boreus]|uniref:XshC-Cox1-family protein n=1 Tax=Subtercola boreus TaxID=120213 RepID=A0A3E0WDS2_9MICO|nr:XdhC/CoxI family protein [Subtercola boreus]RFA22000.1 hypothetical protein B7R24_04750 [Subtercola boreus]RFA22180.1 hypothetical protein B7R23_04695 [Subtercola boreus]RFA28042.1 hypothetical protein B7R25_04820 [Subtercola boreus]